MQVIYNTGPTGGSPHMSPKPTPQHTPMSTPPHTPVPTPKPTPLPTPMQTPSHTPQHTPSSTPKPIPQHKISLAIDLSTPLPSPRHTPRHTPYPTPEPSPRQPKTPRGINGWRPVMPGYKAGEGRKRAPSVVIQRTVEVTRTAEAGSTNLRNAIPDMPKPLAVVCLVFNIILPGFGTFVSGLSILFCSTPRPANSERTSVIWVNSWVGFFQLLTTPVLLFGWFWSLAWGIDFVKLSGDTKKNKEDNNCEEETSATHRAVPRLSPDESTSTSTSRTTTTTTVSVTGGSPVYGTSFPDATAPIIVLQEAPIIVHSNEAHHTHGEEELQAVAAASTSTNRRTNQYNQRHQRIRRMHQAGDPVPNILLDPETLEQLVFHNAPVPAGMQEVEEPQLPISKG